MARPAPTDPLLRGRLALRHHGVALELVVGEGVFSAAAVDPGTRFLLRWLAADDRVAAARRVLDLGCGYGPLGLWLAASRADRTVVAVDRDALAVECTALGAAANGVADRVEAAGSLGYDDLDPGDRFDLVVSNVPAKVGPAAVDHLLLDAWHHLEPDGVVAVVVVDRLAEAVGDRLAADPAVEILDRHANRGYATWTWRFVGPPASSSATGGFERGVYRRAAQDFEAAGLRWSATTSYTVEEFDTLGHGTVAAAELLAGHRLAGPVGVVGTGQGHVALALRAAAGRPVDVRLVDRDLLALRTAAANLAADGNGGAVETHHTARPASTVAGCRSAVVALPAKQPVSVTAAVIGPCLDALPQGSEAILHGRATDVGRVLDLLGRAGTGPRVEDRASRAGHAAVRVVTGGRRER